MPFDRTGLLIIRAWLEPGSSKPLRARLRFTADLGVGIESELTLADVADVSAAVEMWLQDVLARGESAAT
jgi:hypothetical protein